MPSPSLCLVWDFFRLSVEVATTMVTSCRSEWDKTPVRSGHASSGSLLKWEVLLSFSAVPSSYPLYHVFGGGSSLMGLFSCPCNFSIIKFYCFFFLLVSLPWDDIACFFCLCAYLCVYVGMFVQSLNTATKVDGPGGHVTHSRVPLTWGHTERFDVCVMTLECRFHVLPDNEIKEVPSEERIPAIPLLAVDRCCSDMKSLCKASKLPFLLFFFCFFFKFSSSSVNPEKSHLWNGINLLGNT